MSQDYPDCVNTCGGPCEFRKRKNFAKGIQKHDGDSHERYVCKYHEFDIEGCLLIESDLEGFVGDGG